MSPNSPRIRRRRALGTLGALALCTTSATATLEPPNKRTNSHWNPGGIGGVTRTRVGVLGTSKMFGYSTIAIPQAKLTYMMPHSAAALAAGWCWQESDDCTVRDDCQIMINTAGLWVVTTCTDWPATHGTDVNFRKMSIWRRPIGVDAPVYKPGELTLLRDMTPFDRLASQDMPASDVPQYSRATLAWNPGSIAPGQAATIEVALPAGPISIKQGDFAEAALDSLTDARLGAANADLVLNQRIVGGNLVLVQLINQFGTQPIQVPPGTLHVMAGTAVAAAGHSEDSWTTLSTSPEELLAGESIFVSWRSDTPGDFVQCTPMTYVQLELLKRL